MPVSAFLSLSAALAAGSGALGAGLERLGVSKRAAVFFLISAAALSGFEIAAFGTAFFSPACLLCAAAGATPLFLWRGRAQKILAALPALGAALAAGAALAPLFASSLPAAYYAAGLAGSLTAFVPRVRERGAAFVCAWAPIIGSVLAYALPAPFGGAPFLTFSDSVLSAQIMGFLSIAVLSSAFSRTPVRRSSDDRTTA